MFGLDNPDKRRGLRSIIQGIVVLVLLFFVWRWADRLDPSALKEVARWSLGIIGAGTLFYGAENVTRAFKIKAGPSGIEADFGGEKGAD